MNRRRFIRQILLLAVGCTAVLSAASARGDIFVLHGGGEVRGRWLNADQRSPERYLIETEQGVRLELTRGQVKRTIRQRDFELQYEQIAPTFADTLDDQWKLAQWCRERSLTEQRAVHLRRIIELDPEQPRAWRGLGYSQVSGRWVMQRQWRKEHGYVYHHGRWLSAQQVQLLEARAKAEQAERQWQAKLKRWRLELSGKGGRQARRRILEIADPHAVKPLSAALKKEPSRVVKMLFIEALGNIDDPSAANALLNVALNDGDEEMFFASVEQLQQRNSSEIVQRCAKALKDEHNLRVNRAAAVLGRLGDRSVIAALITSLVTTHKVVRPTTGGGSGGAISSTFSRPGGAGRVGGLTAGGSAKSFDVQVANRQVLQALVQLSGGANFGLDQRAWRNWYAQEQNRLESFNARRTPP